MKKERMGLRFAAAGVALVLCAQAFVGCGATRGAASDASDNTQRATETAQSPGNFVSAGDVYGSLLQQYGEDAAYGEPIVDLPRDGTIDLPLQFDPGALGIESTSEVVQLFYDDALTQTVYSFAVYDDETHVITVLPPSSGVGSIGLSSLNTDMAARFPHGTYSLFEKDTRTDWGNVGTMYLALYRDLDTGDVLEEPLVRVVTVKGELEAPSVRFAPSASGLAGFRWEPVDGAEAYAVFRMKYDENGPSGSVQTLDIVDGTSWTTDAPLYGATSMVNPDFRTFRYSENDWVSGNVYSDSDIGDAAEGDAVPDPYSTYHYGVIALCATGCSMFSNMFTGDDLAPNLPYAQALATARENGWLEQCDDVGLAPSHVWITMCDGTTVRKLMLYNTDGAAMSNERYINVDEDTGDYISGEDVPVLVIPYTVEGAPFEGTLQVLYYDETQLAADMATLRDRQQELAQRSGTLVLQHKLHEESDIEKDAVDEEVRESNTDGITANSAFSAYLAYCMLGGTRSIDISRYAAYSDEDVVEDALLEAFYQNPLILGIQGYRISGETVRVAYDDDASATLQKQVEVQTKATAIVEDIITQDMTDYEKEAAINQYLCDHITYDEDALNNAAASDYETVDAMYNDSFTAYGALIEGKCVCAGYAAAFKLLADTAHMDSIVVTGLLEGTVSHAWNKVKVNGEWQIVDVTNNDNEQLFNALFNLPDSAGRRALVEDRRFVLDSALDDYASTATDNEYYRVSGKYFPEDEIARQLAEDITADGNATLRTDYDLTDEQFQSIAKQVYTYMPDDIKLSGYFWMGVIHLRKVGLHGV